MQIATNKRTFFVFDLDDTLYPEIDFLKSAYQALSEKLEPHAGRPLYDEMLLRYSRKENVFQWLVDTCAFAPSTLTIEWLLSEYRTHAPSIKLSAETATFLQQVRRMGIPCGLITDGRQITQRNKLRALGLETTFADVIISEEFGSEKPAERNYLFFEEKYPGREFYFFGDNTAKDFLVPAQLGWKTICLENTGSHIHPQDFSQAACPDFIITSFADVQLCPEPVLPLDKQQLRLKSNCDK
ncbi:HAD family hydrolase [Flavisolibacter nicotianae]|uniref:HAD family hydrolase n=1 Tax=Flavisolibacter nicotianae TaxID=2364882 RepID=UPI000EB4D3B1|nr:HAD family hydrolase [Flavisolibacter nicotianae]